jgi:cell division septum initiation protein DivIVA
VTPEDEMGVIGTGVSDAPEEVVEAIPITTISVLEDLLHQLEEIVQTARGMPLSSSVLVHRQDVVDIIETLKRSLPDELARARTILHEADDVVDRARGEGRRMIEMAKAERDRMVGKTEVVEAATREAERIIAQAEMHARRIRAEAEQYVESKLATFEIMLQKTLQTVERGRARLEGRREADVLAPEDADDA